VQFEIFKRSAENKDRRHFPGIVGEILKAGTDYVGIPGTSRGLLYVLQPPDFRIQGVPPLQFAVVGSGAKDHEIEYHHDMIVFELDDGPLMETMSLRDAIADLYGRRKEPTIGGLYPLFKIVGNKIQPFGFQTEIPHGGTKIALVYDAQGWVQRNLTTGKELRLVPPWDLPTVATADQRFDDLHEAYERFLRG
jgi:hypothetical protein